MVTGFVSSLGLSCGLLLLLLSLAPAVAPADVAALIVTIVGVGCEGGPAETDAATGADVVVVGDVMLHITIDMVSPFFISPGLNGLICVCGCFVV